MKKLLLHICCGPCATYVIKTIKNDYDVTGFFYNPNIHPSEEYGRRLEAAKTVCHFMGIPMIEDVYIPETFLDRIKGLEDEPENGKRCLKCYRGRLSETSSIAYLNGYEIFTSTLTLGPMKKASLINPIGLELAEGHGIEFLEADWKKNDGFRHSCELSNELGIYRQHYCGCIFSMSKENQ